MFSCTTAETSPSELRFSAISASITLDIPGEKDGRGGEGTEEGMYLSVARFILSTVFFAGACSS